MTEICELFQQIAVDIWDLIARDNQREIPVIDERGITGIKIIDIIDEYVTATGTTKVFAQKAIKEPKRGGDLEIYVEYTDKEYLRYFLQAKALKEDGTYHDVNHRVNGRGPYQWDLLLNYSRTAKAIPRYIFYNGITNYKYSGVDCHGDFDEKQYGCAIAEVVPVRDYCLNNNTGRHPFLINNTPPPVGSPWRFIPCCGVNSEITKQLDNGSLRLYSRSEINMDKAFKKVFRFPRISGPPPDVEEEVEVEHVNNELSQEGWNPAGRVIVSKYGIKHGGELRMLG
jgi:hypothetical protein